MKHLCLFAFFIFSFLDIRATQPLPHDTSAVKTQPIQEVTVTGTRNQTDRRNLPYTVSIISRQQIEQRYSSSLLTTLNEQVPGFFSTSRGVIGFGVSTGASGSMNIRGIGGSPTTEMIVLIDGHPQYAGIFGHPIVDAYQDFLAEKVEVLRGPASVLYGSNAMGGVVNIVTRKILHDGNHLGLRLDGGSYGTFESQATDLFRFGQLSGIGSFSYNRSDNQRPNMAFEQMSGYMKANYKVNMAWNTFTDLNLTHFNASNPGTVESPLLDNDQHITRGIWSFVLENDYGNTSGAIKLYYNWGHHKINDGYAPGATPQNYFFKSNDHTLGIDVYQSFQLFRGNHTTFGFNWQDIGGQAWNDYATHKSFQMDTTMNEVAGYADFRQDVLRIFTLDAGLRIDHHSVAGTELIPQFGIAARLPHQVNLKASIGKGFRNPTLKDLFMYRPKNPDLKAERIWNYEIAIRQDLFENHLNYGVNFYYLYGDNLIQTVAAHNQNTGRIRNHGLEISVGYKPDNHWTFQTNYSLIHSRYKVIGTPENKLFLETDYSTQRWLFSVSGQWINRLNTYISPLHQESFFLLNARATFRLNRQADLFLRGENILAQHYEINYGYPMPKATFMGGISIKI